MTDPIDDTAATPDASQAPQDDKAVTQPTPDAAPADGTKPADAKPDAVQDAGNTKPADDWRVRMAGGDEKELKRLGRYATEADVYKAYRELEKKKSSGELRAPLPENPTPEQLAEWRKDHGIPESPDKYDLTFDNGIVIGEHDKPLIDKFVSKMHGENASPAQVKAALASYYEILGEQQQALAESDSDFKEQALEGLREEWAGDYKRNLNAVNGLLQSLPEETRLAFETARTADGKLIGNDPAVIKWLAQTAYEINPAATIMPSSLNNPGQAINDEIASLEKLVGDKQSDYWKGPNAAKNQARYLELLTARDKIAQRG
jgi:sulfite reductase alpha subunit-like flavoprotein